MLPHARIRSFPRPVAGISGSGAKKLLHLDTIERAAVPGVESFDSSVEEALNTGSPLVRIMEEVRLSWEAVSQESAHDEITDDCRLILEQDGETAVRVPRCRYHAPADSEGAKRGLTINDTLGLNATDPRLKGDQRKCESYQPASRTKDAACTLAKMWCRVRVTGDRRVGLLLELGEIAGVV